MHVHGEAGLAARALGQLSTAGRPSSASAPSTTPAGSLAVGRPSSASAPSTTPRTSVGQSAASTPSSSSKLGLKSSRGTVITPLRLRPSHSASVPVLSPRSSSHQSLCDPIGPNTASRRSTPPPTQRSTPPPRLSTPPPRRLGGAVAARPRWSGSAKDALLSKDSTPARGLSKDSTSARGATKACRGEPTLDCVVQRAAGCNTTGPGWITTTLREEGFLSPVKVPGSRAALQRLVSGRLSGWLKSVNDSCLERVLLHWRSQVSQTQCRRLQQLEQLRGEQLSVVRRLAIDALWAWGMFARARRVDRNCSRLLDKNCAALLERGTRSLLLAPIFGVWSRDTVNGRFVRLGRRLAAERRDVERLTAELAAFQTGEKSYQALAEESRSPEQGCKSPGYDPIAAMDMAAMDPIAAMDAAAMQGALQSLAAKTIGDNWRRQSLIGAQSQNKVDAQSYEAASETEVEAEAEPDAEACGVSSPAHMDSPFLQYEEGRVEHVGSPLISSADPPELGHMGHAGTSSSARELGGDDKAPSGKVPPAAGAEELHERVEAMIAELRRPPPPRPSGWAGLEELESCPSKGLRKEPPLTAPGPIVHSPPLSSPASTCAATQPPCQAAEVAAKCARGDEATAVPKTLKSAAFPGRALLRRLAGPRISGARRKGVLDSSSDSDAG